MGNMDGIFGVPFLARKVFGVLAPEDMAQLILCSRDAALTLEEFRCPLCFACTRPEFHSSSPLDLHTWQRILKACMHAVKACSLEPGIWAHSERVLFSDIDAYDLDCCCGIYADRFV